MNGRTIGKVALMAGVKPETVRYYEREGLLEPSHRTDAGYRVYSEDAVQRLRFIRRGKELGFSLREIRELLELKADPSAECADVKVQATTKIADIRSKIEDMKRMVRVLERLTAACDNRRSIGECPILQALEENGEKETKR